MTGVLTDEHVPMNQIWRAFAKVNLDLRILGKRADGFHEIRSVMQSIDLFDEIRVSSAGEFGFTATEGPEDESNLVVRAVRSFEEATSMPVRLRFELVKRIPSGAGLGGGSADAAVTLLGLARNFGQSIPGERINGMLRVLGSDVPYFSLGGRVLVTGRGDTLFPLAEAHTAAPSWLLLVHPDIRIVTAEAYSWLTETFDSNTISGFCARFAPALGHAEATPNARLNDFETALFPRFPELAEIKGKLWQAGARSASLTGSGAALFGEFGGEPAARRAAEVLGRDYDVVLARPVLRADYFRRVFGE